MGQRLRIQTIAPVVAFLLTMAAICIAAATLNSGTFAYAQDDCYIHMSVARNIAENGVWGVNADQFSSAASSLLWPLVLAACFWVLGTAAWVPLALNMMTAIALLVVSGRFLARLHPTAGRRQTTVVMLLLVWCTALPAVVSTGMEHVAHAVFLVLLVNRAAVELALPSTHRPRLVPTMVLAALLVSVRLESLGVVGAYCLARCVTGRPARAALVGIAAVTPVALHALLSVTHGGFLLPNPVVLKSADPELSLRFLLHGYRAAFQAPDLAALFVVGLVLCVRGIGSLGLRAPRITVLWLPIVAIGLQLQFAGRGTSIDTTSRWSSSDCS